MSTEEGAWLRETTCLWSLGQRMRVRVPAGVKTGQSFRLQVPTPAPLPKRAYRFQVVVLVEDDREVALLPQKSASGKEVVSSQSIVEHPQLRHFMPPFAVRYQAMAEEEVLRWRKEKAQAEPQLWRKH